MSLPRPPRYDTRRRAELEAELIRRARMWLPGWHARAGDPGAALLKIAARLESEVTQRLDRIPEKGFRGFLSWLGRRGLPGRAARIPLAFRMARTAQPVLAEAPVQIQAHAGGTPVTFETDKPLQLVPAELSAVIAADPARDEFYGPFAGLSPWEARKPAPNAWRALVSASRQSRQLQLDPPVGLTEGESWIADADGNRYLVRAAKEGIVTIEPGLDAAVGSGHVFTRLPTFDPFNVRERDQQEHALYLGAKSGLDIKTRALIEIEGAALLGDCDWAYWGKKQTEDGTESEVDWQPLAPAPDISGGTFLTKEMGAIETLKLGDIESRWLRARPNSRRSEAAIDATRLGIRLNCLPARFRGPDDPIRKGYEDYLRPKAKDLKFEAIANTASIVVDQGFHPLGREPRLFDAFYLGSEQALTKPGAIVSIDVRTGESFSGPIVSAAIGSQRTLVAGIGGDGRLHTIVLEDFDGALKGSPDFRLPPQPQDKRGPVRLSRDIRPGIVMSHTTVFVSAAAGKDVWILSWNIESDTKEWFVLPAPAPVAGANDVGNASDTVLSTTDLLGEVIIHALFGETLYRAPAALGAVWTPAVGAETIRFARIAPVLGATNPAGSHNDADGIAGVTIEGNLGIYQSEGWAEWVAKASLADKEVIGPEVYPLAVSSGGRITIFASLREERERAPQWAIAVDRPKGTPLRAMDGTETLEVVGRSFAVSRRGGGTGSRRAALFFAKGSEGSVRSATWNPPDSVHRRRTVAATAEVVSAPVDHAARYVFPAASGSIAIAALDTSRDIVIDQVGDAAVSQETRLAGLDDLLVEFRRKSRFALAKAVGVSLDGGASGVILGSAIHGVPFSTDNAKAYRGNVDLRTGTWNHAAKELVLPGDITVLANGKIYVEWSDDRHRVVEVLRVLHLPTITVELKQPLPEEAETDGPVRYLHAASWDSTKEELTLPGAMTVAPGSHLYLRWNRTQWRIAKVAQVLPGPGKIVKLTTKLGSSKDMGCRALIGFVPATLDVETRSALTLRDRPSVPASAQNVQVDLDGNAFDVIGVSDARRLVVLDDSAPGTIARAMLLADDEDETIYQPPRPRNPQLSWEYWDGQSWWQIADVEDSTENFVKDGAIVFKVPTNLEPSDVVGRANHWVRARLVGGDYGQEDVTVTVVPGDTAGLPQGSTVQSVKREPSSITPPYITEISISYQLCDPLPPDVVLTRDNGGYRDQTDANTSPNATVRAFTPLKHALPRSGAVGADSSGGETDCSCPEPTPPAPHAESDFLCDEPAAPSGDEASDPNAENERAIYLGFDAEQPLQGDSIGILFLVEDAPHDAAFPLRVEAYANDRFTPVTVSDDTRALSQSGIITLSLPEPLQQIELFGRALRWIRLKPRTGFDQTQWAPRLKSVHLNAVFAEAAETQRLEVLGSSDGSPWQKVSVARPPVLEESLELRVREPLGDEDVKLLRDADPDIVKDQVGPWNGPWVRWRADRLATSNATARVFELDAGTGELTFGDGRNGAIPPIGQNTIVAVTYQRGGGDEANGVPAWGQVSLVTPLAGVEATIVPEGAAGGAGEQSPEEVMRFASSNLRMRERALTLADVETLALQSSSDIAQIRALRSASGVRVVQVMRGHEPRPTNAARRELNRALLDAMPPEFAVADALSVVAPSVVDGTIKVDVTVSDLSVGGLVAREAVRRLQVLLDPAAGGIDGSGWLLGATPDDADIAERLTGIADLVDVVEVTISPRRPLRPHELFVVRGDAIQVLVNVDEEAAA